MSKTTNNINEMFDQWANDHQQGPVALYMRQALLPVEGKSESSVIFPPTYAGAQRKDPSRYSIDELGDGKKIAQIDSVGSQANRMEPLFKNRPDLVPQTNIKTDNKEVSILDVGHRLGDALIRCSELGKEVKEAFDALVQSNNAEPIARLAPTSLVFGVWDSRGSAAKLPRIVQSVIRAWDVEELSRFAQYNPPVDYTDDDMLGTADNKKEKDARSNRGFHHAPSTETGSLGGVIVHGDIFRDININLVALRRLNSESNGADLRRYILGLALVAATAPQDGFFRQGCLLTPDPDNLPKWELIERTGKRIHIPLTTEVIEDYAKEQAKIFNVGDGGDYKFDKKIAKKDIENVKKTPKKE